MPLQNDARPNEKTVTLRDLRRVAFGLSAAIMIVMIAGAINDDSGSSTATAELDEISSKSFISITAGQTADVAEGSTATTAVMTVATDTTPTGCSISNGHTDVDNDGNLPFAISATCAITINDADDFDFENNVNSWTLTILANDASGADVETVAISVTDVEISITGNSANLAEDASDDDPVLTMASSGDDADANGWSITGGNTNSDGDGDLPFAINSGTGAITVNDAGDIDRETTPSYTLEISISDGTGDAITADVVITITDVDDNDPAFADATASANVDEGTTAVGTYTGTDADSGDTLEYAIVASGTDGNSVDSDLFSINSATGVLTFATAPDFEDQGCGANNDDEVCVVIISVSDGSGNTDTMTITATVVDTNDNSPVFTAGDAATATPNEEQTTIATYGATDADAGASIVYSITGGQDRDLFTINDATGALTFTNAPDFENPGCGSGTDSNTCTVELTATDDDNTNTDTITVTVNIQDTNDNSPVFSDGDTDAVTVNEGTTAVGTYTATDADAGASLTYSIVASGTDGNSVDSDLFSIDSSTGELTFSAAPDFEDQGCGANNDDEVCVVILSVSDTSTTDTITITATVADLNDNSPVFTAGDTATATPNEEQQTIATYGATDADANTNIAYSISGGQDSGLFTVDASTGALTFTNAPDFENPGCGAGTDSNACEVELTASDGTNEDTITVTVNIQDTNDNAPVFSDGDTDAVSMAENTQSVGTYTATDADAGATITYSISNGAGSTDNDLFSINSDTGALTFTNAPDYENPGCGSGDDSNTCTVIVVAEDDDDTNSDTITITITITDAGVSIDSGQTANLLESATDDTEVITLTTSGDTPTLFAINGGDTDSIFAISTLGVITVADNTNLDHETTGSYTLTIVASDATSADVETVTITVTDANDNTPEFDDDDGDGDSATASADVAENSQTVGTYGATDVDSTADLTYSIVASGDNANSVDSDLFTVDQDTGALTFSSAPNYEAPGCGAGNNANSCVVIVQVSDGANTDTITVSVTVTDVNDAPTVSSEISDATIDEDSAYSLVVTSNFADADGDTLTYTASGLPSSGNLAMSSAGTLSGTPLHADIGSYTVVVTATDDGTGTLTVSDTFTLTISNVNDAPSASAGSDQTPTEGDTVTLDASGSSDEDSDSLTYAWSQDSGTTMSLSDTTAASPTFTAPQAIADYTLVFTVTVSDGNGGSDTDSVTITVSADNDAPSITSSAVTSATEDSAYSYTVETSDPESQVVTVSCTTCPNWLSISNGVLSGTPDNSDVGDNAVTLSATDGTTAVTQSFTIAVANVNSMGSVSLSGTTTEDQTLTATVSDPDGLTGVTISYQWQSTDSSGLSSGSWTDISGATSSTYTLTQSEVGKYVRVSVSYTDAQGGVESHTGMMGTTVTNVNDDNTGTPTMSGSFMEDQTVTVDATPLDDNDEDGMTTSSYAYQWQRCSSTTLSTCSDISGETSTSYTITQTDTDNFLRVVVSYTDDLGTAETVNTALSSQVGNINDAPDAGSDQTGALTEDASTTTATGTVSASDPDTTDSLSYTPSSTSGTYGSFAVTSDGDWTYTLDNDDSDTTSLDAGDSVTEQYTITVSDGLLSDTMTVTITITGANDAPVITSTAVTVANEDAEYSYTTTASDDDADDTVTLTCTTVPTSWLSCTDGALTGTPSNSDVGSHDVVITASDGTVSVTDSFTIVVANANDAPTITSTAVTTATEDSEYTYTVTASDVDGDTLTMTGTTIPGWLSFDTTTGVLSGTPLNANVGTSGNDVLITVSDGNNGEVTDSFTITVANTNDAPTITSTADTSAEEDEVYSYTTTASDEDTGDVVTLTCTTVPDWLTCTDGALTGTPGNSDVGSHAVLITATDVAGATAVDSFTIVVANANDAPSVTSTAITDATEDSLYTYTLTASDADSGDILTMVGTTVPSWLSFDETTGVLSGTPTNDDVGDHTVLLTVSDAAGESDTDSFTITVANTNDAPTITSTAVITVDEDSDYSYTTIASDEDAGDLVTLTCTTVPDWMTCTAGALSGTPTNDEVGTHDVVITATDVAGETATDTFTVTVANTNDAPTITSTAGTTVDEDSVYSYSITSADVDSGDTRAITFACDTCDDGTGTSFLSITDNGNGTGTLSGTPVNENVGSHSVTVTVTDAAGATATETFTLVVADTNDAPTITSTHVTDATEDAVYTYTITATDPDGNEQAVYTYDPTTNPSWLSFTDNGDGTATLTGTPDNSHVGTHTVSFSVSDGTAADSASFDIAVANTQDDSTGTISITGTAYEGLTLTVDTSGVSDDDGVGTFTYQWSDADGDISGATSSTYTIPACIPTEECASIGKVYSVTAVHTDAYGVVESLALSAGPTDAVVINPTGDLDSDGLTNDVDTDIDGDGWTNDADAFDYDATEWTDTDSDGIGNNADTDDDGDGVADADDDFPLDSTEQYDADGDGWGHNADVDDDGDGILDADDDDDDGDGEPDVTDAFPNNYNEWYDTDGDGIGNNADTDDDADGTLDTSDAFSLDACADTDTDGDGQPDSIVTDCTTTLTADTDDDGDGYSDADETTNCGEATDPLDATSTPTDTDGDLSCNAIDADDDGDGVDDTSDAFPLDSSETSDYDGDGTGDNADTDDDADGVLDTADAFPFDVDAWTDTDGDGLADAFPNLNVATTFYTISGTDAWSDDEHVLTVTHSDGTVLCQITIDSSAGVSCPSFGLTSGTASVTIYSDYYYNEWDVSITTPSGVTTTYDYSDLTGCSLSTCRYTTQSLVTLSELSDMNTPATSPAGTTLDNDDDGDTVSDSDETAAGTDPLDADTDDDTYDDGVDVFPLDSSEWLDSDSDGMGDNEDAFPTDECATVDTDGDGQPDTVVSGCTTTLTTDVDDDNDGVGDAFDDFPLDASENTDTDNDGTGDNADTDDDGDGYADVDDWAPLDSGEWWDTDGDGIGNNADADDDADGTPDGDDQYPMDNDNDQWDDVYEDACGTDKTSASSTPSDNDGDTVKLAHTGVQSTTTVPVNLCDAIDPDDDNDGYLDGESVSIGGSFGTWSLLSTSMTLPAGETLDVSLTIYSWGSETGLTMVDPSGATVDLESTSFGYSGTYSWSFTDAGTYTFALTDSYGDGGSMLNVAWTQDKFPFDYEAWYDTDGDGLTDYIDPNSTAYSYTTVQLCSGYGQTNPGTPWYTMSSYPNPAIGDYIAVDSGSSAFGDDTPGVDDSVSCTFVLPAGETLTVTLQTANYGGEAFVTVDEPDGTSTTYNTFTSGTSYTVGTYTTAGTYTVTYGDTYGDGCNPSTFYGACFVQASYTYISGTVAPTVTTYGTSLDYDDDNDGYSDLDETTNCDDGGAYASSSLPLDASSTPADMDADLTCDALDSDRDGDTYANDADVFPDDVNEWADNDADGTGDNADTDDDNDLTPDVSDAFPMDECADTDTDGDGMPDTIVSGCTTSLTEDANDDNDQDDDVDDPFPLDDTEWDDTDSDGIGNNADTDDDGDGTLDVNDVWPLDLCAADDFDGDGLPDTIVPGCTTTLTEDTDDDNDGVDDLTDDCPYDANEQVDTDGDGFCDNQDTDDDNDGVYDLNDEYPLDPTEQTDNDGDGIGDNADTDDDNDGVLDPQDAFPNDPEESSDFDGDGIGDNADLDDDGDNVLDDVDPFPLDGSAWVDTDGDGIPDYTGPPPFSGDFEGGSLGSFTTSSLATYVWTADNTNPISGAYSAMTTNQGVSSSASGMMILLTNMVNDTDTDGDGIADAASYSFDYSVSTESGWDYLSFCIDNDANCQRTSGYTMRWSGTVTGTYTGTVTAGAHTFTWNYWKDSSVNGGSDTVWIDNVLMSVPQGITNADLDDDNDGVNDDMDLDSLDPCVGLDTDGDGMSDSLGSTMLNGSACDASMYTIDDDDDNDGWTDSEEAICGSDSLDVDDMPADHDMDMICDVTDLDDDNDGFNDDVDAFPMNSSEAIDTDGDGIGNNADSDDDDDTVTDGLDAFPLDPSESNDNDGDGTGDNADTDDDNDGCLDADDAFPMDASECVDTDGDMLGDNVDPDDDGDGVADVSDPFPLDASESSDNDGDGIGDNTDTDDDDDGVSDVDDMFPLDPLESEDLDGDGQGDNSDADDDGDGVNDGIDAFPTDATEWVDTDGDGTGDNSDADDDGDGVNDVDDAFPMNPSETNDLDGDGLGDNADSDDDGDGTSDDDDAFPVDATEWDDTDGDGIGDNEDTDDDGDDVSDSEEDSCGSDSKDASSVPSDFDGDGICDVLDLDDNDGPDANKDGGDEPGFGQSVPGFPALFAAIALIGAALIGRRRDD